MRDITKRYNKEIPNKESNKVTEREREREREKIRVRKRQIKSEKEKQ